MFSRRYVIALLVTCTFLGCQAKREKPPAPPIYPVVIGTVEGKEFSLCLEALGHIESITSVALRSRVEGELVGVHFEQGSEVKKGDLLFTIDSRPYRAALKEAEGALAETIANLSLAEEKVKRYRTLARDDYFSQIDYETLQTQYAALLGQKEEQTGQKEKAEISLGYCWIYAPIDGKTGLLQIDYGNLVMADGETSLITLNQMDPIFATASIPEFQLPQLLAAWKRGEVRVEGVLDQWSETSFEGVCSILDNQVDPQTGMVAVRATFPNPQRLLWPGQFLRIRLLLDRLPHATVIPYAAVQLTPHGPVVFVVQPDQTVKKKALVLGERRDDEVLVLHGVSPGEWIVLEGQLNLSDGVRVQAKGTQ